MCVHNRWQYIKFISIFLLTDLGNIKSLYCTLFLEFAENLTSTTMEKAIHREVSHWRHSTASLPRVGVHGGNVGSSCLLLPPSSAGLRLQRNCLDCNNPLLEKAHQRRLQEPRRKILFLLQYCYNPLITKLQDKLAKEKHLRTQINFHRAI